MEVQYLSKNRAIFDAFFIESPPTDTKNRPKVLKVLKVVKVLKVAKPSESLGGLKVAKVVKVVVNYPCFSKCAKVVNKAHRFHNHRFYR